MRPGRPFVVQRRLHADEPDDRDHYRVDVGLLLRSGGRQQELADRVDGALRPFVLECLSTAHSAAVGPRPATGEARRPLPFARPFGPALAFGPDVARRGGGGQYLNGGTPMASASPS